MPLVQPSIRSVLSLLAGQPQLLLDLDFRTPNVQSFPTAAGDVIPGRTASHIWLLDEAEGANIVDEVAALSLAPSIAPSQPLDVVAAGFFDGTDAHNKAGKEFNSDSLFYRAAATATLNYDQTDSWAFLIIFRHPPNSASPSFNLVHRTTTPGVPGYQVTVQPNGKIRFKIEGQAAAFSNIDSTQTYNDGAWHCVLAVCDRAGNVQRLITEAEAKSTTPEATDSTDPSGVFEVGAAPSAAGSQIAYLAVFEGAQAEGLVQADLDTFWSQFDQYTSPALDTYTRASLACPEVGADATGIVVAKVPSGGFAFGYDADFSHASKIGALIEGAKTNLCTYSEEFSHANWTATNITVTANAEQAPDKTTTADKLAATANNGTLESTAMTVTSAADYTASVYIKRSAAMGGDVTGRLIHYDATGAAEEAAVAFTATATWQRISVRDASAASTSRTIRIEIDTSGEEVVVWGAQVENDYLTSYIPTASASATRAATALMLNNAGGTTYLQSAQGEIEATYALLADAGPTRALLSADNNGVVLDDRVQVYANNDLVSVGHWDSAGVQSQLFDSGSVGDQSTEHTARYRWDSAAGVQSYAENADLIADDVRAAGAAATWTAGTSALRLHPGSRIGATWHLDGALARIRIWDAPRGDTP